MDVLLIPGFWLDAASWGPVLPALRAAGVSPHPLTMPGVGAPPATASTIGIADWIAAVVAEIDAREGPMTVVGHSGGGNVAWGVADARPDRVARVVLVDTALPHDGAQVSEFEATDGVIPFPGWDFFDDDMVSDLDPATREREASRARSIPAGAAGDPIALRDERRFAIPVSFLMGALDDAAFRAFVAEWGPFADELERVADTEVVRLGTGHWPQFSQPQLLGEAIADAVTRRR